MTDAVEERQLSMPDKNSKEVNPVATQTGMLAPPADGYGRIMLPIRDPYEGASIEPFKPEIQEILSEQVDPNSVEITPDGRVYLPSVFFRRKLNQAFGSGGWAIIPKSNWVALNNTLSREYVLKCHGRFVSEARGEQDFIPDNPNTSEATATEGVHSNAIMRCCKDLCIYTELWDRAWIRQWKRTHAVKVWCVNQNDNKKKPFWRRKDDPDAFTWPWKEQEEDHGGQDRTPARKPRNVQDESPTQARGGTKPTQQQSGAPVPSASGHAQPAAQPAAPAAQSKDTLIQKFEVVLKAALGTQDGKVARQGLKRIHGTENIGDLSEEELKKYGAILKNVPKTYMVSEDGRRVVRMDNGEIVWGKPPEAVPAEAPAAEGEDALF